MTQVQIDAKRLAKVNAMVLKSGAHQEANKEACAMEAVAWLAGEPWSDSPQCVCPVIAGAMRRLNDGIPTDAMRTGLLLPLLPKLIGTRAPRGIMVRRGYVAADFAVRIFLPLALDTRGLKSESARWRDSEEVKDRSSAIAARDGIRAQNYAAYAYAYAYAYAAADAAAYDAAYAAAAAAADAAAAAAAAAADAAADAAAAYAYAAADAAAARRPIYEHGVKMIEVMLAVTE